MRPAAVAGPGCQTRGVFEPIHTERLVLRRPEPGDADALWERRNEPEAARFQSWSLPYPRDRVDQLIGAVSAMDGPADDQWWMATVCLADSGEVAGDLAVHLTWQGRSAEIGFTFANRFWGDGLAREAATALIEWLFHEHGVARISAMTHPDNVASTMLLERLGMLYEGRTKGSYWVDDERTDDLLYGMTRGDWSAWVGRPPARPDEVSLVEITPETGPAVTRLATHRSQRRFASTVQESFADALFPEVHEGAAVVPWLRAVEADGELVGFVMMAMITEHHTHPYLWRLMVDRMHQRRGIGDRILDLVIAQCREWGAAKLETSWVDGRGSPRPFYERRGFVASGRLIDGESEAFLDLKN